MNKVIDRTHLINLICKEEWCSQRYAKMLDVFQPLSVCIFCKLDIHPQGQPNICFLLDVQCNPMLLIFIYFGGMEIGDISLASFC